MNSYQKLAALLCILCIIVTLSSCERKEKYEFALYTKDEVLSMYNDNIELFMQVVALKESIKDLYDKGLVDEYEHVAITSPYAKEMTYLNDDETEILNKFFELKPYMVNYRNDGLYVAISFTNSDATDCCTLYFWTYTGENSYREFGELKSMLAQYKDHIVEEVADGCIISYTAENAEEENPYAVYADSVEDFTESFYDQSYQTVYKEIILQAVHSSNLSFKDYKICRFEYEPDQNDNAEVNSFSLRLRWHNRDSALWPSYRNEIELKLIYNKNGIDTAYITADYSQTDTADLYIRDIGNSKTGYLFLIDNNYFCEYFVDNSLTDKAFVAEQLKSFCMGFDNIIATAKDKA